MVEPGKKATRRAAGGSAGRLERRRVIGAYREDAQLRILRRALAGDFVQLLARDVDRDVGHRALELVEQVAHLHPRATPVLDERASRAGARGQLAGVAREDRLLGARGIVLGQLADLLEESGADVRRRRVPARAS